MTGTEASSPHPGRTLASRCGPLGVWGSNLEFHLAGPSQEAAAELEELGYGALWITEGGFGSRGDVFAVAGVLLAATNRLVIATGIASIWARDPTAMVTGARVLGDAYPERFVLGLGTSHPGVGSWHGAQYEKPLTQLRAYIDAMDSTQYMGLHGEPAPRIIAALGPKMLSLAAERTAGAHPYLVPVEHTSFARGVLGDGPFLAVAQAVVLERDKAAARKIARAYVRAYLPRLRNYAANLRRLGWSEEDLAPSDRLVDALVVIGDAADVVQRVQEHLAAGADHVCVFPLIEDVVAIPIHELRKIAHAFEGSPKR